MVDLGSVQRRLALLAEHRRRLEVLAGLDPAAYDDRRYEARYLVQVSAQISVDLANHLIADAGWPAARDQRDALTRLAEHEVLDGDLASRLRDLTGLRNRLVHLYADVDDALVQAALPPRGGGPGRLRPGRGRARRRLTPQPRSDAHGSCDATSSAA